MMSYAGNGTGGGNGGVGDLATDYGGHEQNRGGDENLIKRPRRAHRNLRDVGPRTVGGNRSDVGGSVLSQSNAHRSSGRMAEFLQQGQKGVKYFLRIDSN